MGTSSRKSENPGWKLKSAWDKFFDNTEDIQCISCLDAYVLKYAVDGCWVRIDRNSSDKDSKFTLSIRGYFFHE